MQKARTVVFQLAFILLTSTLVGVMLFSAQKTCAQASGCIDIQSVQLSDLQGKSISQVELGVPFQSNIKVDESHANSYNVASGIEVTYEKDGKTETKEFNWCPSHKADGGDYFAGWQGSTATFRCVITKKDLADSLGITPTASNEAFQKSIKSISLYGHSFNTTSSCDTQGKRLPLSINFANTTDTGTKNNSEVLAALLASILKMYTQLFNGPPPQPIITFAGSTPVPGTGGNMDDVFQSNESVIKGQALARYVASRVGCVPEAVIISIWEQETGGPGALSSTELDAAIQPNGSIPRCGTSQFTSWAGAVGITQFMPGTWTGGHDCQGRSYDSIVSSYESSFPVTNDRCNALAELYATAMYVKTAANKCGACTPWTVEDVKAAACAYYGACADSAADYANDIIRRMRAQGYTL